MEIIVCDSLESSSGGVNFQKYTYKKGRFYFSLSIFEFIN